MIVRSKAPLRISFGGGGTDVPPYCDERGGYVVNAAINKYAFSTLETRRDKEIHIESADFLKKLHFSNLKDLNYNKELDLLKAVIKNMTLGSGLNVFIRTDVPPKSGLGSSASAFVSLIGSFNRLKRKKNLTDYEIAELSIKLERNELKIRGGKQDQYASIFGGINFIEFKDGRVRVNPMRMRKDSIMELEKNLVLVYTKPRANPGDDIIADQVKRYRKREKGVIEAFDGAKAIAEETRYALSRGDLNYFGELLGKSWEAKKRFSPMISDSYIDKLFKIAKNSGAIGGKLTGAGGGGCMFFYCKSNTEQKVAKRLQDAGATPIPFSFDYTGLQTWDARKEWGG